MNKTKTLAVTLALIAATWSFAHPAHAGIIWSDFWTDPSFWDWCF